MAFLGPIRNWKSEWTSGGVRSQRELLLLGLGFAALVAVALTSLWLVKRNAAYSDQVARTLEAKAAVVGVLGVAQDAETGQRGYLLTDDEGYLFPYKGALDKLEDRIKRAHDLIGDDGEQAAQLELMIGQLRVKLRELAETIELQKQGKTTEARALVETDRGREAMRAIRRIAREMTEREDAAFESRSAAAERTSMALLAVMVIGLLVAATLAILARLLVGRQTRELKMAQEALAEANTGLEAAVVERTAELTSANQEIQRFAYIVSHDLRAPLVNVMGFTSELDAARRVLKEQIDGLDEEGARKVSQEARLAIEEDLPEAIGFIRTSTAKMDRLINAILRLSRDGNRAVKPEQVQVEQVVKTISDTIYQQTQSADAEIDVRPGLPSLVTDKIAIEQIFQNLIENAVKYLDRSRPGRIVVAGRRVGAMVEYSIEDNGRGIAPQDQERVFELFRRAGTQDQPGEGLGLAFVRASVRRLGGTIRLTSEFGRGSTFYLTFPAVFRPQSESRAA